MDYSIEKKTIQKDISLSGLTITVPGRVLINSTTVAFPFNSKTVVIGRNGIGKSSLIKCLADVLKEKAVTLEQFAGDNHSTISVLEAVTSSDNMTADLQKREKELLLLSEDENADFTMEMCEELDRIQDHLKTRSQPHEAHIILHGLGFIDKTRLCNTLSGGWLQRLALAKALYSRPAFFILDEPTNHLDIDGVEWLSNYLQDYKRTLVVVTHDLAFCETFATRIISITSKNVLTFNSLEKALEHQDLKKMKKFKFPESSYQIRKNANVQLRDVSFKYTENGPLILNKVDFCVDLDSKLIIVGPNGCGKSTLIKLIAGFHEPTDGEIVRERKMRYAYMDQHEIAKLESDITPIEYISSSVNSGDVTHIHEILSKFDVKVEIRKKKMKALSGGEKARVLCALIACKDPHMILLDEPTNHLDFESTMALASAVKSFPLATLVITHNKTFIEMLGDKFRIYRV